MIAKTKKKNSASKFPRAKITRAVEQVIPNGQKFHMHVSNSAIGKMKVVRVVTHAWKSQPAAFRITKVLNAVDKALTNRELGKILRVSVLTPDEYRTVVEHAFPVRGNASHRAPAKRKAKKRRRR
jgi:hypothetical protein